MIQSKKMISKQQLLKHHSFLQCPICKKDLRIIDYYCVCNNKHSFDIAKKGYVNFASGKGDGFYNTAFFNSRKNLLNAGLFDELIEQTYSKIISNRPQSKSFIDIGCGEGYFINHLIMKINEDVDFVVGIDLSKDAITLATSESPQINWFVADLTNIPCKEETFDVAINVFTPANYSEFHRVLKKDGILIKIVPSKNHFIELREALGVKEYNQDKAILVESVLFENFDIISKSFVTSTTKISKDTLVDLINMSPLSRTKNSANYELNQITIDAIIYVCKKKAFI